MASRSSGRPTGGTVVRITRMKRLLGGIDNMGWCIEIGFADFKVDHISAPGFEVSRFDQDFERSFGAKLRHPARQVHRATLFSRKLPSTVSPCV